MPLQTKEQLQALISISSQIVLIAGDEPEFTTEMVTSLLSLNRDLVKITGTLRAYQRFINTTV